MDILGASAHAGPLTLKSESRTELECPEGPPKANAISSRMTLLYPRYRVSQDKHRSETAAHDQHLLHCVMARAKSRTGLGRGQRSEFAVETALPLHIQHSRCSPAATMLDRRPSIPLGWRKDGLPRSGLEIPRVELVTSVTEVDGRQRGQSPFLMNMPSGRRHRDRGSDQPVSPASGLACLAGP